MKSGSRVGWQRRVVPQFDFHRAFYMLVPMSRAYHKIVSSTPLAASRSRDIFLPNIARGALRNPMPNISKSIVAGKFVCTA